MWWKLSKTMPINTKLNLKASLREKEADKISETCFQLWCNVLPSARLIFCATDLFPGTFIDSRFRDIYRSLDERFSTLVGPCP